MNKLQRRIQRLEQTRPTGDSLNVECRIYWDTPARYFVDGVEVERDTLPAEIDTGPLRVDWSRDNEPTE